MTLRSLTVLALFALVVGPALEPAQGHVGDRVHPIYQLTDEMFERIDVMDGSVDEWMEMEPSLTLVDIGLIREISDITERDPADLDFRIWLGWVPSPVGSMLPQYWQMISTTTITTPRTGRRYDELKRLDYAENRCRPQRWTLVLDP